jgi:hypothetical protein
LHFISYNIKKEAMKNIHVIPTDKPSRLFYSKEFEFFKIANKYDVWREGRNIYITNSEEIKEGDWFLWQGYGGEWFKEKCEYMLYEGKKTKHLNCHYKTQFKIILTTDQDLIKDGIQAITDEFLEWFVKNPSCEMVEVKKDEFYSKKAFIEGKDAITFKYKIIIPKEELHSMDDEVECNMCGGYMYLLPDNSMYVCTNSECTRCYEEEDEEPEQETLEDFINLETDTFGIGKNHIPKEEQKQHLIDLMRLDEQENLNISDVSDSYNLDLPMEYEKVRRKIKKYKNRTDAEWVMFKFRCKLIDLGVITTYDTRNLKPILWDADGMMKIADERFGNINDETFHKLYKDYKSKL